MFDLLKDYHSRLLSDLISWVTPRLSVRQDGTTMGLGRDRDIPFGELQSQTHVQLLSPLCVLLLALGGDTEGSLALL